MTISKAKIKIIKSMHSKKMRTQTKSFLAEGPKLVDELLTCTRCSFLVATSSYLSSHPHLTQNIEIYEVTQDELAHISQLQHPQQVLGIFNQIKKEVDYSHPIDTLCLALEDVQDPGNLGTILRIADWFGITNVYCSKGTVDMYNPKVVQATMGAIARVNVYYVDLFDLMTNLPENMPIYGTLLDGENIFEKELSTNGLIVMGNEGRGLSDNMKTCITDKLFYPSFPPERETSESLNVAMATALICGEFRRKNLKHT